MYEFTNKEIRTEFKKTEYGKKTNKMLLVSLIIFFIILLVIPLLVGFILGATGNSFEQVELIVEKYNYLYEIIVFIFATILIYFDGKRDGAIEHFKRTLNK